MIEGINSLVQAAKAGVRGYRTTENFIAVAYLVCGKLNFKLPTWNSEESVFCTNVALKALAPPLDRPTPRSCGVESRPPYSLDSL